MQHNIIACNKRIIIWLIPCRLRWEIQWVYQKVGHFCDRLWISGETFTLEAIGQYVHVFFILSSPKKSHNPTPFKFQFEKEQVKWLHASIKFLCCIQDSKPCPSAQNFSKNKSVNLVSFPSYKWNIIMEVNIELTLIHYKITTNPSYFETSVQSLILMVMDYFSA